MPGHRIGLAPMTPAEHRRGTAPSCVSIVRSLRRRSGASRTANTLGAAVAALIVLHAPDLQRAVLVRAGRRGAIAGDERP